MSAFVDAAASDSCGTVGISADFGQCAARMCCSYWRPGALFPGQNLSLCTRLLMCHVFIFCLCYFTWFEAAVGGESTVSIYSARAYSSSDAVRGATRWPVLFVHVMVEVKCLEMRFKKQVICCTGVCHVAARSKVVIPDPDTEKRRSLRVVSVRGTDNKSSLEECRVHVGSCGFNMLVRWMGSQASLTWNGE